MTPSIESIIDKMKTQPAGIRPSEVERVLEANGYRFVRQKGSHKNYRNGFGDVITIKIETPLKAVYVKDVLKRIKE
ncbi:MAG: type II toxin-antitoxin system HicA family toxin [Coriobacteriales bacterium]|jgi:predicted RNA binding protein YcfA (HicA-like mRNA interferase family)|nr:type II toxin-antitoxin system HicA family toxin [Coriobacteriales bacterium]